MFWSRGKLSDLNKRGSNLFLVYTEMLFRLYSTVHCYASSPLECSCFDPVVSPWKDTAVRYLEEGDQMDTVDWSAVMKLNRALYDYWASQ